MVVEFGMSVKLGPLSFGQDGFRSREGRPLFPGERPEMSEQTARIVDEEVSRLVTEAHDRAREILERDSDLLRRLSDVLVEREAIDGKELLRFVEGEQPIPTKEQLVRESQERREEEEKVAQPSITGPAIIPSIRGDGSSAAAEPAEQIPARPDWA
jgi:cell division protease FtsH